MSSLIELLQVAPVDDADLPDFLSTLADQATALSNISTAYADACAKQQQEESIQDSHFISSAKDFIDLHHHVESSTTMLDSLESFLSTFQHDLSAVSGHISELQVRSKNIEAKSQGRKALETSLNPLLSQIIIPPELIDLILETEPSQAWLQPVTDLGARLTAIRSGPRVPSRQSLDNVAEKLRIKSSEKLRKFFVDLFHPFRTSIALDLQHFQDSRLMPYRELYAFLQRHAPRQAHEVQKAYIAAMSWYYETGFRRYTRALERVRLRSLGKGEGASGKGAPADGSLSSMVTKNLSSLSLKETPQMSDSEAVSHSRLGGQPVLNADTIATTNVIAPPEALFRFISLVLSDNAQTEYQFLSAFFGQPIDIPSSSESISDKSWDVLSRNDSYMSSANQSVLDEQTLDDSASIVTSSEVGKEKRDKKTKAQGTDACWKQIMMPVMEYCKSFITSLLEPAPSALSVLAMIRLNDALFQVLIVDQRCPHPEMESYLMGIRLQLWPLFNKDLGNQAENLKRLIISATGGSGLFGSKSGGVKDSVVQKTIQKYISLFNGLVQLSHEEDEDMVFSHMLRLRGDLEKLLEAQASRLTDKGQVTAYLDTHYEELLAGVTMSLIVPKSNHERLLNACYPKGSKALLDSAPAFAPVSNDLGKLLYYCSSRKPKAVKIAKCLCKRVQSDVQSSHKPVHKATLCISLTILQKLVMECKHSVEPFANESLDMLLTVLTARTFEDVDIMTRTASAFAALSECLNAAIASVDAQIATKYVKVLQRFCVMALQPYDGNPSLAYDLRSIAFDAIQRAINSDLFTEANPGAQVELICGSILGNLTEPEASSQHNLESQTLLTDDESSITLSKVGKLDLKHNRGISFHRDNAGEKENQEMSLEILQRTLLVLKGLMKRSQPTQLLRFTAATCDWIDKSEPIKWKNVQWCSWLADTIVRWVQLQYRFAIISVLLDKLLEVADRSEVTEKQTTILSMLSTVFLSTTSLLGFDTGDFISSLMSLLQRRAFFGPQDPMLEALVKCIASLGKHNYYPDQLSDSVQDIIGSLVTPNPGKMSVEHRCTYVQAGLSALLGLLSNCKGSVGKRNHIKMSVVEDSLSLWTDTQPSIRHAYSQFLSAYFDQELESSSPHTSHRHFFDSFHATAFYLALGKRISAGRSPISTPSGRSRKSSVHSEADVFLTPAFSPTALDFVTLKSILVSLHAKKLPDATMAAVPMLYKLELESEHVWLAEKDHIRRLACSEVCLSTVNAVVTDWQVVMPGVPLAEPNIISRFTEEATVEHPPPLSDPCLRLIDSTALSAALSHSTALQKALEKDADSIFPALQIDWTAEKALKHRLGHVPLHRNSIRNLTPNTSTTRLVNSNSVSSLRNPSIADLRASLVAHSVPISSVASSSGGSEHGDSQKSIKASKRQSSRSPTKEQLALLGIKLGKTSSRNSRKSSDFRTSSLSKPPLKMEEVI